MTKLIIWCTSRKFNCLDGYCWKFLCFRLHQQMRLQHKRASHCHRSFNIRYGNSNRQEASTCNYFCEQTWFQERLKIPAICWNILPCDTLIHWHVFDTQIQSQHTSLKQKKRFNGLLFKVTTRNCQFVLNLAALLDKSGSDMSALCCKDLC